MQHQGQYGGTTCCGYGKPSSTRVFHGAKMTCRVESWLLLYPCNISLAAEGGPAGKPQQAVTHQDSPKITDAP